MSETDDGNGDLDALIEVGTRILGLPIAPEWREAIRLHLAISLAHARAVAGFALPDDTDPAPVFAA
ncbi:MAG: DUF4089 domain-containing protein [Alphaproteobacteria bacterium]|nr:DUF4089 domain-containing protein [Alphaproteobacteria bacterium]MBV9862746.1 DUF4089 domain-containing protein [Alphaproteobacteria bacterium]